MDVRVAVRVCDFFVVDFAQPVVCGDRAAVAQDQTADRIRDRRVFFDAPVGDFDVAVDQIFVVENGRFHITDFFALLAVQNVRFRNVRVAGLAQYGFDAVLNVLDCDFAVFDLRFEVRGHFEREHIHDTGMILLVLRFERLGYCNGDLLDVKLCGFAVALDHLIHKLPPVRQSGLLLFVCKLYIILTL